MPYIDENRVKGNYGSSSIMKELCKFCLVRPVSEGTDQGIDLYCETFEIPHEGGRPFLHFWVQVKTTTQIVPLQDGAVSFNLSTDHLQYWNRQPVPVFVFLIPIPDWPLGESIYPFYIIDIKSAILESPELLGGSSHNLRSNLKINSENELRHFILDQIPYLSVSHMVSEGIIPSIPTLDQEYVIRAVAESCYRYLDRFLWQIRKTSALAILGSFEIALSNPDIRADVRRLSEVSRVFSNDNHYETPFSLGLAEFLNGNYEEAKDYLERAINIIDIDPNIARGSWEPIKEHLREIIARCDDQLEANEPI